MNRNRFIASSVYHRLSLTMALGGLRQMDSGQMDSEQFTLLSVPEFAKALGVKPSCIRRWILLRKITYGHFHIREGFRS
jgi:hypothetical protein